MRRWPARRWSSAVAILESLRVPLADGADVFSAWKVTSDAIGRGGPGPLRDVLVALRGRIHDRLVAAHLDYLRARPDDGQARARAWLELLARALAELRLEVVKAISRVPPPDGVAVPADLVAEHRRDLDREDYGLAYPLFAAVAAHPLTPPSVRMGVTARCAEIQVYRLADPAAGRALLDRLPSASAGPGRRRADRERMGKLLAVPGRRGNRPRSPAARGRPRQVARPPVPEPGRFLPA